MNRKIETYRLFSSGSVIR